MLQSKYEYMVFDCDGVIIDSNAIKTDVFEETLRGESPDLVAKLLKYHKDNGGITRQKKFEYFFKEIKHDFDDAKVENACLKFGQICKAKLLEAKLVSGIEDFLSNKIVPAFVVTGGNEAEVKETLEYKGLSKYFDLILGNPKPKLANMRHLEKMGLFSGPGVYFGDARLDYELAKNFGLDFIFISGVSEWNAGERFCEANNIEVFTDFISLKKSNN